MHLYFARTLMHFDHFNQSRELDSLVIHCAVSGDEFSFLPYYILTIYRPITLLSCFLHCKGGCDEEISVFLYKGHVDKEVIVQLQRKETGLREHGELIVVHVVAYENLWRVTADAKTLVAIALYEMAKKTGLLPPCGSPTTDT